MTLLGYLDLLEERLQRIEPITLPFRWTMTGSRDAPEQHWRAVVRSCVELVREYMDPCAQFQRGRCQHIRPSHGGAWGTDTWFDEECRRVNWKPVVYPITRADWAVFKGAAGPRRNRFMLDTERPQLVTALVYRRSSGTTGCMNYARSQGLPVVEITELDAEVPRAAGRATM